MNEQALRQLLIDADAAAGATPGTSIDLASRVQKRFRRRRQSQVAVASIFCVSASCGIRLFGAAKVPRRSTMVPGAD